MKTLRLLTAVFFMALIFSTGCKTMNRTQKGVIIGSAGGAAAGAVIGRVAGNTGLGTIIGATVGGVTGGIIGHKMDKQAEEMKNEIPGVNVERIGEGIVVEFNNKILFGYDQSDLSAQAKTSLDKLVVILQKYPETNIEVQGHTDNTGTSAYNMGLSESRASAVASYLNAHGIYKDRLNTKGFGETAPKYENKTAEGQAQNRRGEFLITANEKMKADAAKEAAKTDG